METGRHMILQTGIFQATNSFSWWVSVCSSSLAHILYSHSTLHSRTESIPAYFFTSTALCICLTDLITCVVAYLFMEMTVLSRLSKTETLTTFDSSATKYCLALGKCSRNIFWIIMNEEKGKKKTPMNAHFSGKCLFIKNVDSRIKYTRVLFWFLTGKYVTLASWSLCFVLLVCKR